MGHLRSSALALLLIVGLSSCDRPPDHPRLSAPTATTLTLSFGVKQVQLSWPAAAGATHYRLFEDPDGIRLEANFVPGKGLPAAS